MPFIRAEPNHFSKATCISQDHHTGDRISTYESGVNKHSVHNTNLIANLLHNILLFEVLHLHPLQWALSEVLYRQVGSYTQGECTSKHLPYSRLEAGYRLLIASWTDFPTVLFICYTICSRVMTSTIYG